MGLAPPALVCVTGANGFVGSHIVDRLLERGYRVRAAVRDPSNEKRTRHLHEIASERRALDRFELVAADLVAEGSFDDAVAGCEGVFHCAAVAGFVAEDPQRSIVDPSVVGTRNVLTAVARSGTVRRVVHTSSIAAVYHFDAPADPVFTEADWNTTSTLRDDPYGLAKAAAEREAVALCERTGTFELVRLNPGMIWGPPLAKIHCSASPSLVRSVLSRSNRGVPRMRMAVVDVRDVATAHVLAMEADDPPARALLVRENLWMAEVATRLQALFPDIEMATREIPTPVLLLGALFSRHYDVRHLRRFLGWKMDFSSDVAAARLGVAYRSVDQTLEDTAEPMIRNGWARVTRR